MKLNEAETDYTDTDYTDEALDLGETLADFLPSPAELARAERKVKITIALSGDSLEYFQNEADRYQISYQKMIRRILDDYVLAQKRKISHKRMIAAD